MRIFEQHRLRLSVPIATHLEETEVRPDRGNPLRVVDGRVQAPASPEVRCGGVIVALAGWIKYARLIEEAGADALELNVYFVPSDPRPLISGTCEGEALRLPLRSIA